MSRWVGVLLLVAGCGKSSQGLKDLQRLELQATATLDSAGSPSTALDLHFAPACYGSDDTFAPQVHLEGHALERAPGIQADGGQPGCYEGEHFGMDDPANLPPKDSAASSYFLSDGTTEAELRVDHLFTARQLAVVEPADRVLHPGGQVVVEFSPPVADLAAHPPIVIIQDSLGAQLAQVDTSTGLTGAGSRATFPVPDGLPRDAEVRLFAGAIDLPVLRCTLAQTCRAVLRARMQASAHTAP